MIDSASYIACVKKSAVNFFTALISCMLPLTITQAEPLHVLTTTEPPYSYKDKTTNLATGYSTDIARAVMEQAGVEIEGSIEV